MNKVIIAFAFLLTLPVEAKLYAIDLDPGASTQIDFEKRAVIQIKPAQEKDKSCTAIQVEEKIFLMAGHCVDRLGKQAIITDWKRTTPFKVAERIRQLPTSIDGTSTHEFDAAHNLGLALLEPKDCGALRSDEKHTLPLSEADATPIDQKFQLAAYGTQYGSTETDDLLLTVQGELVDGKALAKRTIEIIETPIVRELTVRRQGTLFMEGDSSAILIQKDKSGKSMISGVLSTTDTGDYEKKTITIRREGDQPVEIAVSEKSQSWLDRTKSALDFDSVKKIIKDRKLSPGSFEISRSYEINAVNVFSSLTDPANREWLQKSLEDLRQKRSEKFGCERKPASKK